MTVTISGNGTFTGTSLVANNIAANTITSNNILSTSRLVTSNMPAGSVLQVQHNVVTTNYTGASASYVQVTAFNQTFTPLYSTSKVLVILSTGINLVCDGNVALTRGGTIIKDTWFGSSRQDDVNDYPQATGLYLDSPNTTSAITYGVQVRATGCSSAIRIGGSDNHQSWTFMEIAA